MGVAVIYELWASLKNDTVYKQENHQKYIMTVLDNYDQTKTKKVETSNHYKNGATPKSHKSRINSKNEKMKFNKTVLAGLSIIVLTVTTAFINKSNSNSSLTSQINLIDTLRICTEIKEYNENGDKIVALKREKWSPGQTLRVKFLGGDDFVQSKVKQFATEWANHCSIKFQFVTTGTAEIRVNFAQGRGSWSLIGKSSEKYSVNENTGNVYVSSSGTTMNFGWFNSYTTDEEFSRTVIHEFGHAIGLIHEHQSPAAGISWNKPEVYKYYLETQGWTKGEVDQNIFRRYSKSETQYSAYDKLSIMHYSIPAFLLLDPTQAVGWNTFLSATDKSFIPTIYPKPINKTKKTKREHPDHHGHEGVGSPGGGR